MAEQHFLTNIFNSKNFTNNEVLEIISKFKKITFSKNEFLLSEGNVENNYWFIESGFVRSYAVDIEGNDISTNFYAVGDVTID